MKRVSKRKTRIRKSKKGKLSKTVRVMRGGLSGITYFQLGEEAYNASCYNSNFPKRHGNDFDIAMVYYEISCELGYTPACAKTAWLLLHGRSFITTDHSKCFNLVNGKEDPDCKGVLGYCYLFGIGCTQNEVLSLDLARDSASKNSKYGQCVLGRLYYYGLAGLQIDYIQTIMYYKLAVEQALDIAQLWLGETYINGLGVLQDTDEALKLFTLAAYQGNINACFEIIKIKEQHQCDIWYNIAFYYNTGSVKDHDYIKYISYLENELHKKPIEVYDKLFALGQFDYAIDYGTKNSQSDADIKYNLLWLILSKDKRTHISENIDDVFSQVKDDISADGKGILAYYYYINKVFDQSITLARESSDSNSKYGQYTLGELYRWSKRVPNNTQALVYYRLAAEKGFDAAQYDLGYMYELAQGVSKDSAKAMRCYQLAASNGYKRALEHIASCYQEGRVVSTNNLEAIRWLRRSDFNISFPTQRHMSERLLRLIIDIEKSNTLSESDINSILESVKSVVNSVQVLVVDVKRLIEPLKGTIFPTSKPNNGLGKWKFTSLPGVPEYYGQWKDGLRHGMGKLLITIGTRKGETYEGEWFLDKEHGRGKFIYASGNTYEGEFRNGTLHGMGKYLWTDGNIYEGIWEYGNMHGIGVEMFAYPYRFSLKGKYINDLKQGPFIFEDLTQHNVSKKQIFYYKDNQLHKSDAKLAEYMINSIEPSSLKGKKYISIIINLHGSDIINTNCNLINKEHHIRLISPISCGRFNIINISDAKSIFNTVFNICHLKFNKNVSSYQKMNKFVNFSNRDKIGSFYDIVEDSATLRKPLIEHKYSFDIDILGNLIYVVDTNHQSSIISQQIMDEFAKPHTQYYQTSDYDSFNILPDILRLLNITPVDKSFLRSTLINALIDLGYETINIIDLSCRVILDEVILLNLTTEKPYQCDYGIVNMKTDDNVFSARDS